METLKDFLWPIVAIGGLGAFIDFLIGKAGQAKAKDFLLKWWIRFDDVRWRNFGREEGLFAGELIERWFGRRIWNFRRIASALLIFCSLLLFGHLFSLLRSKPDSECCFPATTDFVIFTIGFCVSVSFTKLILFGWLIYAMSAN
jgi:hypothetical protein